MLEQAGANEVLYQSTLLLEAGKHDQHRGIKGPGWVTTTSLYVFKFNLAKAMMSVYKNRPQHHITTLPAAMMQVLLMILGANKTLEVTMNQDIITIQDTITQAEALRAMQLCLILRPATLVIATARWESVIVQAINEAAAATTVTIIIVAATNLMPQRLFTGIMCLFILFTVHVIYMNSHPALCGLPNYRYPCPD